MGISLRIFVVDDDDLIKRIPLTRYERLFRYDPKERFPEYAGKRVRYAEVAVELVQRKPVEILRMLYFIMSFDSEGRIDASEHEKETRLAMELLPPFGADGQPSQVIEAQHRFAKKRYDNEYRWTPSPEIEAAIIKAIFGSRT
ncbi:MAG TPA: hypothetical protein EYP19_10765 [Desulfobacterales bacterium]|jgi:hypothetical protein|nr:hypothetical protein [Desulfobacterales bacterium]